MAPIPADIDSWEGFGAISTPSTDNSSLENADDSDDSDDSFKTWIYGPLIAFMLIALAIVTIQFRRRRSKVVNNLMLRQALARDIEALGPDPNNPGAQRIYIVRTAPNGLVLPARGRGPSSTGLGLRPSRWQWSLPTTGPRRSPEEGLDELGEAPPPYDASKDPAIPLNQVRPATETTLSRISEEVPRVPPVAAQLDGSGRTEESTAASATNTETNTTTNTITASATPPSTGDNTTVASTSTPLADTTREGPESQPSAPPPAYVRFA